MSEQTLRDTFAAAALNGLLAGRHGPIQERDADAYAQTAGVYADAMLRERARANSADISTTLRNGAVDDRETVQPTITDAEREAILYCVSCAQDVRDTISTAEGDGLPAWRIATKHIGIAMNVSQRL